MRIEIKYSINQEVWFISNNKICNGKIDGITVVVDKEIKSRTTYIIRENLNVGTTRLGEDLFETKEKLIKSL